MSETTNIHPEDLLDMLKHAERLGAYKALNWLRYEFTDNMTTEDIAETIYIIQLQIGEELWNDFKREHWITTSIRAQTEKRLKEKGTAK